MESLAGRRRPSDRYSWDNLRHFASKYFNNNLCSWGRFLLAVIASAPRVLSAETQPLMIDALTEIAELLLWEDQHRQPHSPSPTFFDAFMEHKTSQYYLAFLKLLCRQPALDAAPLMISLLQSLTLLFENLRNRTWIYTLLSENYVNDIILWGSFLRHETAQPSTPAANRVVIAAMEEVTAYYVTLLKALSLRLNADTLAFFFNHHLQAPKTFPLYTQALPYVFHPTESMVRIAARNLCLNVWRIAPEQTRQAQLLRQFLMDDNRSGSTRLWERMMDQVALLVFNLNEALLSGGLLDGQDRHLPADRLQETLYELQDYLYFIQDTLALGIEGLNDIILGLLMSLIVRQILFPSILQPTPSRSSSPTRSPVLLPPRPMPSNIFQVREISAYDSLPRLQPQVGYYMYASLLIIIRESKIRTTMMQELCKQKVFEHMLERWRASEGSPLSSLPASMMSFALLYLCMHLPMEDTHIQQRLGILPRRMHKKLELMHTLTTQSSHSTTSEDQDGGVKPIDIPPASMNLSKRLSAMSMSSSYSPASAVVIPHLGPLDDAHSVDEPSISDLHRTNEAVVAPKFKPDADNPRPSSRSSVDRLSDRPPMELPQYNKPIVTALLTYLLSHPDVPLLSVLLILSLLHDLLSVTVVGLDPDKSDIIQLLMDPDDYARWMQYENETTHRFSVQLEQRTPDDIDDLQNKYKCSPEDVLTSLEGRTSSTVKWLAYRMDVQKLVVDMRLHDVRLDPFHLLSFKSSSKVQTQPMWSLPNASTAWSDQWMYTAHVVHAIRRFRDDLMQ